LYTVFGALQYCMYLALEVWGRKQQEFWLPYHGLNPVDFN